MAFFLILLSGTPASAAPDAIAGKEKAQLCAACHGEKGVSSIPGTPHLAAQPPLSIFYQLLQFRDQRRKGGGMEAIASTLSEQDMRDIAAHYASQPAPAPHAGGDAAKIVRGQQIAQQQYCSSCHGAQLQGQKHVPRLSGQSTEYFVAQLRNLRSGARADMDGTMASAARSLTDEEIEAMAVYARSLP
ncbi:c-type cytochrome [Limnohabitans sp.]|uniref:c-type cytochrome n=1 Tax=Limnohabitans sp. TaxID=1907725 RepID=UPI00286FA66F|nr:c-type cytochrome [Limnohabitans sp.]